MRVLMTADTLGGVWQYALELARGLEPFGVEILLAAFGGPPAPDQDQEAAQLANLRMWDRNFKLVWMDDPWTDLKSAGDWLLEMEQHWQPDVVHLNDFPHGDLNWSAPVLMVGHSCVLSWWAAVNEEPAPASWDRYHETVARGLLGADMVVAPTRWMLTELENRYGPFADSRVIANGRRPSRVPIAAKEPLILSAGRVWDQAKNIRSLARVASDLAWPVYVAGETQHPNGGDAAIRKLNLLGQLDAETMATWYNRASVYAHPARYEPFGLSILEAASAGCALVLGDIPSLRETWNDAAFFVDPADLRGLRSAIGRLIRNPTVRIDYATRARTRSGRFGADRMAAEYHNAYVQLMQAKSRQRLTEHRRHGRAG